MQPAAGAGPPGTRMPQGPPTGLSCRPPNVLLCQAVEGRKSSTPAAWGRVSLCSSPPPAASVSGRLTAVPYALQTSLPGQHRLQDRVHTACELSLLHRKMGFFDFSFEPVIVWFPYDEQNTISHLYLRENHGSTVF